MGRNLVKGNSERYPLLGRLGVCVCVCVLLNLPGIKEFPVPLLPLFLFSELALEIFLLGLQGALCLLPLLLLFLQHLLEVLFGLKME